VAAPPTSKWASSVQPTAPERRAETFTSRPSAPIRVPMLRLRRLHPRPCRPCPNPTMARPPCIYPTKHSASPPRLPSTTTPPARLSIPTACSSVTPSRSPKCRRRAPASRSRTIPRTSCPRAGDSRPRPPTGGEAPCRSCAGPHAQYTPTCPQRRCNRTTRLRAGPSTFARNEQVSGSARRTRMKTAS